ncbi:MAG TPA: outer membrane lipoprotein chaperone LolA [Thermoanaerobaculia bacterium]|jgi:outer membrane lipoprotein carrier protein
MKIIAAIISTFFAATLAAAPIELDRAATAMAGMEATFTHQFTPKGFKTTQSESGSVVFGTMPQMRWSYTKPEQKMFVFDGTQSWFYVPADRQVTVGRIDEARKRELPFLLLGDAAARERNFVVKQKNSGGNVLTTLEPRAKNALIRNVVVTINPSTHLIQRIEYSDREGNRTAFNFSGYHRRAASADLFRFTPPAGVQVVNAN